MIASPLSDYAGYDDLLAYMAAVPPEKVLTLRGFAREFATTRRARGIEAWAVGRENQMEPGL